MTSREELSDQIQIPHPELLKNTKRCLVRVSSGSSGREPVIVIRDVRKDPQEYAGLEGRERYLLCLGALNLRLANLLNLLYGEVRDVDDVLCLDARDLDFHLTDLLADLNPRCVVHTPSFLASALEQVQPQALQEVTYALGTGEPLAGHVADFLEKKMPHAQLAMLYGSAELSGVTVPCRYLGRNQYHPKEDVPIAIVGADEEGIGELVVSKRHSESFEMIDYYTGDAARLVEDICQCGNSRTFELKGRINADFVRIGGATLVQEEFDRVAKELAKYIDDYRVEIRSETKNGYLMVALTFFLIPKESLTSRAHPDRFIIKKMAEELFVTPTQTLGALVEKGIFRIPKVVFRESFPSQGKNIKLKRVE